MFPIVFLKWGNRKMMRLLFVFLLSSHSILAASSVVFKSEPGKIAVEIDGKPFTNYYYNWKMANPFLHPLRSTTGLAVTRGFPVEKVEGESSDHISHHGLWYSHGDINDVDFWRETTGDPAQDRKFPLPVGRMVPKSEPKTVSKGDSGTLMAELALMTPEKKSLGTVVELFTFSRQGTNHVVDLHVTLRADQGVSLKMGDTEEGSLGLRFADEFRQDRGAMLSNSDGLMTTEKIWGKRAKWVDYSTTLKGQKAGVVILDHPKNPKHPTYWHARGYGLCAANAFGEHDFYDDKSRDGSVTIPKDGKLEFRYRIVIHQGDAKDAKVEELSAAFK
jgi:hypothetical protein